MKKKPKKKETKTMMKKKKKKREKKRKKEKEEEEDWGKEEEKRKRRRSFPCWCIPGYPQVSHSQNNSHIPSQIVYVISTSRFISVWQTSDFVCSLQPRSVFSVYHSHV